MKAFKIIFSVLVLIAVAVSCGAPNKPNTSVKSNLAPLDSIRLSDPFILADSASQTYYMTGTGGQMWKSKDLKYWEGPFKVAETDFV